MNVIITLKIYSLGLIRKKDFKLPFVVQVFNSCSRISIIPLVENYVQETTTAGTVFFVEPSILGSLFLH